MYYLVTIKQHSMVVHLTRSDCEGLLEVLYIHCMDENDDAMSWNDTEEEVGC
jgi:hypothetical protein